MVSGLLPAELGDPGGDAEEVTAATDRSSRSCGGTGRSRRTCAPAPQFINACVEKLAVGFWAPAFTAACCVVPIQGYFEWTEAAQDLLCAG